MFFSYVTEYLLCYHTVSMNRLTSRQGAILNRVVDAHIDSAQPVGSRLLTERFQLKFSAATVRHEMGILEEEGFLTHPHVSSGRIPTDLGYRYYLEHDFTENVFPEQFSRSIKDSLWDSSDEFEFFAERVSGLLSSLSEEASLVLISDPPADDLESVQRRKLYWQGSAYILEKPEFQDMEKIRVLFKAFEEKRRLMDWLARGREQVGVTITIGHENEPEALWDCSVISTPYYAGSRYLGTIAVVGPRRMRYAHTIPLVRQMSRMINDVLAEKGRS